MKLNLNVQCNKIFTLCSPSAGTTKAPRKLHKVDRSVECTRAHAPTQFQSEFSHETMARAKKFHSPIWSYSFYRASPPVESRPPCASIHPAKSAARTLERTLAFAGTMLSSANDNGQSAFAKWARAVKALAKRARVPMPRNDTATDVQLKESSTPLTIRHESPIAWLPSRALGSNISQVNRAGNGIHLNPGGQRPIVATEGPRLLLFYFRRRSLISFSQFAGRPIH